MRYRRDPGLTLAPVARPSSAASPGTVPVLARLVVAAKLPQKAASRPSASAILVLLAAGLICSTAPSRASLVELRQATIVCPPDLTGPERKAIEMLQQEVQKRTQVEWPIRAEATAAGDTIFVGPLRTLPRVAAPFADELIQWGQQQIAPEGFRLVVRRQPAGATVIVAGNDSRGVLFGVGRLLREM
jgi:hypothetical protein